QGPQLYIWRNNDMLKSFSVDLQNMSFSHVPKVATNSSPPTNPGYPGGVLALSSNGSLPSSGILWATTSSSPLVQLDAPTWFDVRTTGLVDGILRAFDAESLRELWHNTLGNCSMAPLTGCFSKFGVPTVANGKVYVPTFAAQTTDPTHPTGAVAVFGLNPTSHVLALPATEASPTFTVQ